MARDSSELDDDVEGHSGLSDGNSAGNNGLIDRRSYLKLAGAATVAATAATAVSASDEDVEVIEADNSNYRLDDGEVFENKIIDFTNGNWMTILASGTNWTIRNVGFRGTHTHDNHAIVARDEGGNTSTIENVYLGDGCVRPSSYSSHGQCGIFVHRGHSGHLDIRNVYLEDWPNNGIYASAAAYDTPGTVRIENCFGKNNYVSSFRISDDSEVVDSVAYNDGSGRYRGRPFWGWGDQEISGCDFDGGSYGNGSSIYGRSGSRTHVEDTRHSGYSMSGSGSYSEGHGVENGGSPDLSVPDGVPTSASEAAGGESSGDNPSGSDKPEGDHDDLQHVYEFAGRDEDEATDYYFEVEEGPIKPSTANGATIDEDFMWVSDDGARAAGRISDDHHAWEFDTDIVDATVDGSADVTINGVQSHLDRYPLDGATGDGWKGDMPWHGDHPELQHTYQFVAEGEDEPTDYYFEVEEGPIEPSTYRDAEIEDEYMWVSDDGHRAAGRVVDGTHAWEFDTDLIDVTIEGPAYPLINDVDSYPSRYPLEGATGDDWKGDMPWHDDGYDHTILIDGVGTSGGSRYEFAVGGSVRKSTDEGATIDDEDVIDSGTVTGSVAGWRDAFRFTGDLEELTVDGPAHVYLDGERVDPSDYGEDLPHTLTVVGDESQASYEITVDGTIDRLPGEALPDAVDLSDDILTGIVEDDVQRYRFSGGISDITFVDGSADVYVDDEPVDPDEYGETELLPHAIVIDGTDADGETTYSFEIDGDVLVANYRDATVDEGDVIEGTSVSGSVDGSRDAYWFDGDIADFTLAGDANVDVEYNARSEYSSH
ncbi:hypothetical protein [Natronolimnohabitans innermongolicus]|uniref:hypothetical protein n=1 Tax=Natronolimnohabitans innermongolicus TaxID=253107 RepID=UPI00187D75D5|nr:hypothetical protein [Natronolimnohabitans innermongolicus]